MAVGTGHLLAGHPAPALTGFHDLFDGPVAKAAGTASVRGAFFDSVADRVADAVLMGGVAWYLVRSHEGELVLLPLAILGVTSLISYQRAKAEALGLSAAKGGLMERAERMILLGVGLPRLVAAGAGAVGPPRADHGHGRGAVRPGLAGGRGAAPAAQPGVAAPRWRRRRRAAAVAAQDGSSRAGGPGVRASATRTGRGRGRRAARAVAGPAPGGAGQPDRPGTPAARQRGRAAARPRPPGTPGPRVASRD